jgi:hypothetical protein
LVLSHTRSSAIAEIIRPRSPRANPGRDPGDDNAPHESPPPTGFRNSTSSMRHARNGGELGGSGKGVARSWRER